jgi:hypothetical protein
MVPDHPINTIFLPIRNLNHGSHRRCSATVTWRQQGHAIDVPGLDITRDPLSSPYVMPTDKMPPSSSLNNITYGTEPQRLDETHADAISLGDAVLR